MQSTTIDLSWLCFVILVGIVIVAAVFGTRSRLRYARRIREAQARGAFADMNTPENRSRIRRFALLALTGTLSIVFSIVMLLQPWIRIPVPFGVIIVVFVIFAIMASVGGFLMQREIDRRL